MKHFLPHLCLFLLFLSCQNEDKPKLSFYYWKTQFRLSSTEKQTLQTLGVQTLYTRYFDIDLHPKTGLPFPLSPIYFKQKENGFTYVPVIYIKNKVFLSAAVSTKDLALKTYDFIQQINRQNQISITEIQIDCDWSLKTKERYLSFLNELKKISAKKISATIRLHQIKYYKKTKIPNVDYGVLMFYNMGEIGTSTKNSIYDSEIAERYLPSLKNYPLQLKVALPIFSWAIHIRNNTVFGLRNKIDWHEFQHDNHFVTTQNNWLRVVSPCYKKGIFYRKGDLLKLERISSETLLQMTEDLATNQKETPKEILFYDLDPINLRFYETQLFEKVRSSF